MYCPKCGQQQVSDEMRFCSRCGLALSGLTEWIAGTAVLVNRPDATTTSAVSPRRKRIRRAGKLMFFSGVLMPVFLVFSLIVDEGVPMLFPVAVFFVALMMMVYARLFSDETAPVSNISPLSNVSLNSQAAQTSALGSSLPRGSLPAANTVLTAGRQQVRTNELAQPPSVTENTTRLLDDE